MPGDEPIYLFQSLCGKVIETRPAWAIQHPEHQGGMLRMQCGRTATDPLWPVNPNGRKGCAGRFTAVVTDLP